MQEKMALRWKAGVVLCLLVALVAVKAFAQGEGDLTAKSRLFSGVGARTARGSTRSRRPNLRAGVAVTGFAYF